VVRQLLEAGLLDRPSNRGPSPAETTAESTPAAIATGQSAISGTSAAFGCELGSLASELADQDEGARAALAQQFANWEELLAAGLARMRRKGVLRAEADPSVLATSIMAALGGYLLAQVTHDAAPMEVALDMALDRVRAHAAPSSRVG
jgi:hypothetical protein